MSLSLNDIKKKSGVHFSMRFTSFRYASLCYMVTIDTDGLVVKGPKNSPKIGNFLPWALIDLTSFYVLMIFIGMISNLCFQVNWH